MPSQVKDFIAQCLICNQFLSKQQKEPILIHEVSDKPWSKVSIDLFTLNSKEYITMFFL